MTQRNRLSYPIIILLLLFLSPTLFLLATTLAKSSNKAALLGQSAGLSALSLLALVILLPARVKVLERITGQDRLINCHRVLACLLFLFIVTHVVLVNVGKLLPLGPNVPGWALVLGQLTALGILGGIIGAVLQSSIFPDYNKWRFVHRSLALLVITATVHGLFVGEHLRVAPLNMVFLALLIFALLLTTYRRFYVPSSRESYEVAKVQSAADKVVAVTLRPQKEPIEATEPGQFAYLEMALEGISAEEHPFTISAQKEDELTFTIKQSGDFTNKIGTVKEGDQVLVDGPYGTFGHDLAKAESFIFVAGGVGITPLYSLYMNLKEQNDERPGIFITAARHRSDLIFGQELQEAFGKWKIIPLLSAPDEEWQGAKGHVDKEFLQAHVKELLPKAQIYLCGPEAMMSSVTRAFAELSVPASRIQSERFTFP